MRYVDIARITRDVYLTDLAVVISTNFYFTIQHRRILLLLYVRFLKFKERKKIRFYCRCFVAFVIASLLIEYRFQGFNYLSCFSLITHCYFYPNLTTIVKFVPVSCLNYIFKEKGNNLDIRLFKLLMKEIHENESLCRRIYSFMLFIK